MSTAVVVGRPPESYEAYLARWARPTASGPKRPPRTLTPLQQAILDLLRDAQRPWAPVEIRRTLGGTKKAVEWAINGLIVRGDLARMGIRRGVRVGLPAVIARAQASAPPPRPRPRVTPPPAPPAPTAVLPFRVPRSAERRGPVPTHPDIVAAVDQLKRDVVGLLTQYPDQNFRQLSRGLTRCRTGNWRPSRALLMQAIDALCAEGKAVREVRGREFRYRLPRLGEHIGGPVRTIPVPPFDAAELRARVETALAGRRACTLSELVSVVHEQDIHATRETVTAALEQLDAAGQVRRVAFGAFTRWERVPQA